MKWLWKWLQNKTRREVLAFIGTGVAVIVSVLWTGYVHFEKTGHTDTNPIAPINVDQKVEQKVENTPTINVQPAINNQNTVNVSPQINVMPPAKSELELKIEATYTVCEGEQPEGCPKYAVWVPCGTMVPWAAKTCGSYQKSMMSDQSGGMCGYAVAQIKCMARK